MGVGLSETFPGFGPAGALRATKFAPGEFVEPIVASQQWLLSPPLWQIKNPADAGYFIWRRGWDSNPRRATNPCWFSRPVHSTALPPLLICARIPFLRGEYRGAQEYLKNAVCSSPYLRHMTVGCVLIKVVHLKQGTQTPLFWSVVMKFLPARKATCLYKGVRAVYE